MNWDRIEGNWKHFKDVIKQQWDKLTDQHLDEISGKRDKLVGKIQQCYDITKAEADRQVQDWEVKNHDVFAETSVEVKKHTGTARQ